MEIFHNFPLAKALFYTIGGTATYVLSIQSQVDLLDALAFVKKENITRILPVGLGSNLLVSDNTFDGAVLWFHTQKPSIIQEGTTLKVFASATLDQLIQYTFQSRLVGLEWAGGLPSTVGAAVRGNVGCFGKEIKDSVVSVDVIDLSDPSFAVKKLTKEDMQFTYRTSTVKENPSLLVVSATFQLQEASEAQLNEAKDIYAQNIAYRKEHHPVEYPSCGSVFKNIIVKEHVEKILAIWPDAKELVAGKWHNKVAMGYVINRLGLTGKRQGNAQISEKHANYIVNLGGASFDDVYTLIQEIQQKVEDTFGFSPEPEVQIVA